MLSGQVRFKRLIFIFLLSQVAVSPWLTIYVSGVQAAGNNIERVSVSDNGTQGNGDSGSPRLSYDGRYVAFLSSANNLVPNDTNGCEDAFRYDRETKIIQRVSLSSSGTQGNGNCYYIPSISGDGRYIAFESHASNLVPNDLNGRWDIFVRDCQTNTTTIVSVASNGTQGNHDSSTPSISADGRYVTFESFANNLVPNDTNNYLDIFVHDLQTQVTTRVSVSDNGTQGNAVSSKPCISDDGRYVVFESAANNLIPDDTNIGLEIFIRDLQSLTTRRVSIGLNGAQANSTALVPTISADGRYVAFSSDSSNLVLNDTNGQPDVFVYDRLMGTTSRISVGSDGTQGNGISDYPNISDDGHYVAFISMASNLVANDTNNSYDVFVHHLQAQTTMRVNVSDSGAEGNRGGSIPCMSGDGRYISFGSYSSNLVPADTNAAHDVFVADNIFYTTPVPPEPPTPGWNIELVSLSNDGIQANKSCFSPKISSTGRYVVFDTYATNLIESDKDNLADIYVRDRQLNTTTIATVSSDGKKSNWSSWAPSISEDGRYVVFESYATNLIPYDSNGQTIDIFIRDLQNKATTIASISDNWTQGNDMSQLPIISGNNRFVAFQSLADNLVPNDANQTQDIFVRDLVNNTTRRINVSREFAEANQESRKPSLSYDGRYIAFGSGATNLIATDTNGQWDVFVRDSINNDISRVSVGYNGTQSNNGSSYPSISYDGRFIAFMSGAWNLVPGDTNLYTDIFIYDSLNNTTDRASTASDGTQSNNESFYPSLSSDGRYVVFRSYSSNLVPNDTNNLPDIFVHDFQTNRTAIVSVSVDGVQANGDSWEPDISGDGSCITFQSSASNLAPDDANDDSDIFVADNPLYAVPPPAVPMTSASVAAATGTGTINLSISNGNIESFTAVSQNDLPCGNLPTNTSFPHGFLSYHITDVPPGSSITITLNFPSSMATGAQYWQCNGGEWVSYTPLIGDDDGDEVLTLTLTDGGDGDCDGQVNGEISDPGGPALSALATTSTSGVSPSMPNRQLNTAQISLQYLSVNPQQAQTNQPLTISGNVVNTGDQAGNYNLALKINGHVEQTRMVSVGPQASQPVKFTISKSQPGTYTVDIGGQRETFTVLGNRPGKSSTSNNNVIVLMAMGFLAIVAITIFLISRRSA